MANNKIIDLEYIKAFRQRLDDRYIGKNERVSFADLADNLTPYGDNSGLEDDTPFVFQSSGGDSDIGSYSLLKELRGNTIKWNQQTRELSSTYFNTESGARTFDTANNSSSIVLDSAGEIGSKEARLLLNSAYNFKLIGGHKYLIKLEIICSNAIDISTNPYIWFRPTANHSFGGDIFGYLTTSKQQYINAIITYQETEDTSSLQFRVLNLSNTNDGDTLTYKNVQIFDLTQIFGAGNEPTTVLEFNRLFPKAYYQYNAGDLISCKTSEYKIVGYNQLNPESLRFGSSVSTTNGGTYANENAVRTLFIRVIAGQKYTIEVSGTHSSIYYCLYETANADSFISGSGATSGTPIELPNNAQYIRFSIQGYGTTFNNDICFHLTWDETKTGYEEYKSSSREMPNIELRSAGNVYDTIKPNGTYTKRIGMVKLGTLTFVQYGTSTNRVWVGSAAELPNIAIASYNSKANIICPKYETVAQDSISSTNMAICVHDVQKRFIIHDETYDLSTEAGINSLKNDLANVYVYYEIDEPVITQVSPYIENLEIDDWGTQEFIAGDVVADVIVPQGNSFFYAVDYKAFIDSLGQRQDIDYDSSEIVSQTQLQTAISQIPTPISSFEVITAPTSTTLTNDEVQKIVKGCIINGTFASHNNMVMFPAYDDGSTYKGIYIYADTSWQGMGYYWITKSNNYCSIRSNFVRFGSNSISINSDDGTNNNITLNGKKLPNHPSNAGTFVLKCVDGTLTWVAE